MRGVDTWQSDFAARHPLFAQWIDCARVQPKLAPFVDASRRDWPSLDDFNHLAEALALETTTGLPVRFAPPLPRGRRRNKAKNAADPSAARSAPSYAARIMSEGKVATRTQNWHDFFNVLTWPIFPKTKAALYTRYAHIEETLGHKVQPGTRTREQDRLTMFDEGGVVVARKMAGGAARVLVFGHALFEAIIYGHTGIRAMAWHIEVDDEQDPSFAPSPAAIDAHCAKALLAGDVFTQDAAFPPFALS